MQLQALAKGMAVGVAAGAVGYLVSNATAGEKSRLKRRTIRAVRAIGAVMDSAADFLH